MGSFINSLQSLIGGTGQGPTAVPPMAGEEYINPGMKMFGMTDPAGGIDERGAIPQGSPGSSQGGPGYITPGAAGADAVVKGFKPRMKPTFFQALGDQLLMHWGNKPVFAERRMQKNYRDAMEGWQHDPEEAIARIGQFDPETAWKLLDMVRDNKRADQTQDRLMEKDQQSILKRASGTLGVALRDPTKRGAAISRYNQVLRNNGLQDYVLGDDVEDATLESIFYGEMPPNQQEQNERRKERLAQTGADTESKIAHREAQEASTDRKLDQAAAREKRIANTPKGGKAKPKVIMTPGGNQMIIHPSGLAARMIRPDGSSIDLIKFGNGWKIRPPKPKAP